MTKKTIEWYEAHINSLTAVQWIDYLKLKGEIVEEPYHGDKNWSTLTGYITDDCKYIHQVSKTSRTIKWVIDGEKGYFDSFISAYEHR